MKYKPNHKAGKLVKINHFEQGGSVRAADTSEGGREARAARQKADDDYMALSLHNQEQVNRRDVASGLPSSGLPIIVKVNGRPDPSETGRIRAKNYTDAVKEKYDDPESARARAAKNKSED